MATILRLPANNTSSTSGTPSDELLTQACSGNPVALEEVLKTVERRVYTLAYRLCWDTAQAEDVAQDALLKLCRNIGKFRVGSNFWSWMSCIVVNQARDVWRASKHHEEVDDALPAPAGYEPVRSDKLRHVMQAMGVLTTKEREAIVMTHIEGYTAKEAGKMLRCLPTTVRTQASQARKKLREKLSHHYPELREAI